MMLKDRQRALLQNVRDAGRRKCNSKRSLTVASGRWYSRIFFKSKKSEAVVAPAVTPTKREPQCILRKPKVPYLAKKCHHQNDPE